MTIEDIKVFLIKDINRKLRMAEEIYGIKFLCNDVFFSRRYSRTVGCYYPDEDKIGFSEKAIERNVSILCRKEMYLLKKLVSHEVAHLVDKQIGRKEKYYDCHDGVWIKIAKSLGDKAPSKVFNIF